jgi:hypothetical protein
MFEGLEEPLLRKESALRVRDLFDAIAGLAELEMVLWRSGYPIVFLQLGEVSSRRSSPGIIEREREIANSWIGSYVEHWSPT